MHRFIYFVFILAIIYLKFSSSNADANDDEDDNDDFYVDSLSSVTSTSTSTTTVILEPNIEEIVENITEFILVTTTIANEEITKSFLTQVIDQLMNHYSYLVVLVSVECQSIFSTIWFNIHPLFQWFSSCRYWRAWIISDFENGWKYSKGI